MDDIDACFTSYLIEEDHTRHCQWLSVRLNCYLKRPLEGDKRLPMGNGLPSEKKPYVYSLWLRRLGVDLPR